MLTEIRFKLLEKINPSSVIFFRIAFGLLMAFSQIRFISYGWVNELYIKPSFFFKYYGFSWIHPLPDNWMYLPYIILIILALMITIGFFYRIATVLFFIFFTYTELLDQTNYLNHYYFITLISFLMIFLPLHYQGSLDAYLNPKLKEKPISYWVLFILRLQVGLIYFFAGVAKIKPEWLFEAQPLTIWLKSHADFPLLGTILIQPITAYLMSWSGMIFDLTIVFFLLYRKTRIIAYLAVIFFHFFTWFLFNIGMFPWIMMFAATIFFDPSWPDKFFKKLKINLESKTYHSPSMNKLALGFFSIYFLIQIFLPLRYHLYPGNVLWTEQGFNFSWKVMLMEKNGYVEYTVIDPQTNKKWIIHPKDYLTPYQVKQFSSKPIFILQLAHQIEKDFRSKGIYPVEIYAYTQVSLHGKKAKPIIDPKIDLTKINDSFLPANWITNYP